MGALLSFETLPALDRRFWRAKQLKYVPYSQLNGVPNIVVDGAAQADTVLTLSHWPGSGSPPAFRADTSTEIVLNYLAMPGAKKQYAPRANAVSNNHFDEDGLCAVWAMLHPKLALEQRDLLVDVATAGDFDTYRRPQAAKVVFIIRSYADPVNSPVASELQKDDGTGSGRYQAILPLLKGFLDDTDRYGPYWSAEWSAMLESKTAMVMGDVELHEIPSVDLAVAKAPMPLHPMVLYNQTERLRVLTAMPGGRYLLRYRYETWVQFASRTVMPRVDLKPLLPRLQHLERAEVTWTFDGIAAISPALQPLGPDGLPGASSLSLDTLLDELVAFYEKEQNKEALRWDPYRQRIMSDEEGA
jgi:Family of unknown function (DUF6687)